MGLYTACAFDLLGVKLSPRRLFFEIETKYMPHISCQLWVLFTQRWVRYNVYQPLRHIVDYARSCFNARGASPRYCLRHCLWRFNQVAAASKRGEARQRCCKPQWGDNVAFKEAGQRLRLIRTKSFPSDQTFFSASSDQRKGIWLNEPEMLSIAHQNNSIKKITWFDLILFNISWACLPFGSPFFVSPPSSHVILQSPSFWL